MSLHIKGLVISFKDQEATSGGVSVTPRVGMHRICYEMCLRHLATRLDR